MPDDAKRDQLKKLIEKLAIKKGEVTLASGAKADYYIDCRKVTLDSIGAALIGEAILERLSSDMPDAVGGMAIGADPITGAVITSAGKNGQQLNGFIVRKEEKQHGLAQMVEGPITPGQSAVMLEDVVTTGGSSIKAIDRARNAGLNVVGIICIVDRLAGGRQRFEDLGISFDALFDISDFGLKPM